MLDFVESDGGVLFSVRVVPRASKSGVAGVLNGSLKVRLASPPVDGKANAELIRLIAKEFGTARGAVEIVGGERSRQKRLRIGGLSGREFVRVVSGWDLPGA